jgi:hypothetical protein
MTVQSRIKQKRRESRGHVASPVFCVAVLRRYAKSKAV